MLEYDYSTLGALTVFVQVILPIIVAVVVKTSASERVKAIVLLALTSVAQFSSAWVDNFDHFNWRGYAVNVAIGFVISVASYFGLWNPTGVQNGASKLGPQ